MAASAPTNGIRDYRKHDIRMVVSEFQKRNTQGDRYASFDYCYNYFRSSSGDLLLRDMERSCTTLGFYLASWGMLRPSSFLLDRSAKYFQPLVEYFAGLDDEVWEIDVHTLRSSIERVRSVYEQIRILTIENDERHLTLVTKIMLGVLGIVPAFDRNFCDTFRGVFGPTHGFRSFSEKSLLALCDFYDCNKDEIDGLSATSFTRDFATGEAGVFNYPRAKIVDMYGFTKSLPKGVLGLR